MMLEDPDFLRILTLLVLDGDTEFVLLPLREMSIEHLVREQAAGHVGCDDVEVFHVAVMSLLMGYVLFRERYGAEFGIPLEELDARLIQALVRGDIVHDLALDAEEASPPDSPGHQQ